MVDNKFFRRLAYSQFCSSDAPFVREGASCIQGAVFPVTRISHRQHTTTIPERTTFQS